MKELVDQCWHHCPKCGVDFCHRVMKRAGALDKYFQLCSNCAVREQELPPNDPDNRTMSHETEQCVDAVSERKYSQCIDCGEKFDSLQDSYWHTRTFADHTVFDVYGLRPVN